MKVKLYIHYCGHYGEDDQFLVLDARRRDSPMSGDPSDSDVCPRRDTSGLKKVVRQMQMKLKKQDKTIKRPHKFREQPQQLQQHSTFQEKVASLGDIQSHLIAGETLEILFESQSYYFI